jgi:hypothetical protein
MAELREALVGALVILEEDQKVALCRKGFVQIKTKYCDLKDAIEKCRAALAAPPRNYEVGSVEEQAKRFAEYCETEVCKRKRCKSRAKALCIERGALAWAQMPYVEKDGCTK